MFGRNKVNQIIADLDQFIDKMDECVLLYKNGIRNYLEGNSQAFADNIKGVMTIRESTTDLRRNIENSLYSYTLVSENRVDILQLLEHMDMIVGQLYKNLVQYEIEIPFFPSELNVEFLKLVELASLSVEITAQSIRNHFRSPQLLQENIHRIYYYEKEADKLAQIDTVINSVTAGQSHGILLVMVLIPFIMMIGAYLLYKKHYILDEDEYDRIVRELAEKNAK